MVASPSLSVFPILSHSSARRPEAGIAFQEKKNPNFPTSGSGPASTVQNGGWDLWLEQPLSNITLFLCILDIQKNLITQIQSQREHDEEDEWWTEAGTWGLDRRAEAERERGQRPHLQLHCQWPKRVHQGKYYRNWHRVVPSHGTSTITALIKCYP